MKKLLALTLPIAIGITLTFSPFTPANAQYTILHAFAGTDGSFPIGALTLSGKTLYGMADTGGANNMGCIFSLDTTGANYKDIFDFNGTNGQYPQGGALKLSGTQLFGMVYGGGANDSGCIFSIDTNGTAYKVLLNFNGPNGSSPIGSLTLAGKKLFGMTFTGGINSAGNVFTIDTTGMNYKDLIDFNGTNGLHPYGDLTIIGDKLYGMTEDAGAFADGNIFSIDSNGANYTDLYDFNGTTGKYCNNLLELGGSQFFGMTYIGGAFANGNVFSIDTNGTFIKDLLDFNGQSSPYGSLPEGDVILSGQVLFGMALEGGASDSGCIFSMDTNGNNYTDIFDFNSASGNTPFSNVTISGNNLYGTVSAAGPNSNGAIFKYTLIPSSIKPVKNNAPVTLYPNPSNGQFIIHTSAGSSSSVIEVYNGLGEIVYNTSINQGQTINSINISSQPNGLYLYRVLTETGKLAGEGKLMIQK
jgi:uncharacterized repeat protein (TIGR03803 family)